MGAPPMAGGATMGGAVGEPMGAPPMAGGGAMMRGMMPMMPGAGGMGGIGTGQVQIVRDPTAPRNVVYFVIMAQLNRPVQVASSLMAQPTAAAGVGEMPGAMPGVSMPGGMMMGGSMSGGMMGAPGGMPGAGPAAPPAPAGRGAPEEEEGTGAAGRLGRRGAAAGLE